jgi:uncharacterized membrane protein YkoI
MKINRFIALAAIALLVVGAMGALSMKVFAQSNNTHAMQAQSCDQQDDDTAEVQGAPDTDNVDLQCGDQNEADGKETVSAADIDNVEEQVGDQNAPDTGSAEVESANGQDAAPTGTPAITAEAAQKTAEAYLNAGTATKVELDDENGQLVYSVEFANGTDVKVDAMTGSVLGAESGED